MKIEYKVSDRRPVWGKKVYNVIKDGLHVGFIREHPDPDYRWIFGEVGYLTAVLRAFTLKELKQEIETYYQRGNKS